MIEIHSTADPQLTNVPTCYNPVVKQAVLNLYSIHDPDGSSASFYFFASNRKKLLLWVDLICSIQYKSRPLQGPVAQ